MALWASVTITPSCDWKAMAAICKSSSVRLRSEMSRATPACAIFALAGRERFVNRLLHGFGHGVAPHPLHRWAHVRVAPVKVHGPDHVRHVVGQKAVALFRQPQGLAGFLAGGQGCLELAIVPIDVQRHDHGQSQPPVGVHAHLDGACLGDVGLLRRGEINRGGGGHRNGGAGGVGPGDQN
jgi:hypothetical protein